MNNGMVNCYTLGTREYRELSPIFLTRHLNARERSKGTKFYSASCQLEITFWYEEFVYRVGRN